MDLKCHSLYCNEQGTCQIPQEAVVSTRVSRSLQVTLPEFTDCYMCVYNTHNWNGTCLTDFKMTLIQKIRFSTSMSECLYNTAPVPNTNNFITLASRSAIQDYFYSYQAYCTPGAEFLIKVNNNANMTLYFNWNTSRPTVETWGLSYYRDYPNATTGYQS